MWIEVGRRQRFLTLPHKFFKSALKKWLFIFSSIKKWIFFSDAWDASIWEETPCAEHCGLGLFGFFWVEGQWMQWLSFPQANCFGLLILPVSKENSIQHYLLKLHLLYLLSAFGAGSLLSLIGVMPLHISALLPRVPGSWGAAVLHWRPQNGNVGIGKQGVAVQKHSRGSLPNTITV